jgi:hypothetical protein
MAEHSISKTFLPFNWALDQPTEDYNVLDLLFEFSVVNRDRGRD